jgi:hypothetical protein
MISQESGLLAEGMHMLTASIRIAARQPHRLPFPSKSIDKSQKI